MLTHLTINMILPISACMLLAVSVPPSFALGLGIGVAVLVAAGNIQRAIASTPTWRWVYALTALANAGVLILFSQLSVFTFNFMAIRVFQSWRARGLHKEARFQKYAYPA